MSVLPGRFPCCRHCVSRAFCVGRVAGHLVPCPTSGCSGAVASWYTCRHCGRTSYHWADLAARYCGACHHYCDDYDRAGGAS